MTDLRLMQYQPLARAMSLQHERRLRPLSAEELFSEAMIAIWKCSSTWQEGTNRTFGLYAKRAIENAFGNLRSKERAKKRYHTSVSTSFCDEDDGSDFVLEFVSPYPGQEWLLDRKRELEKLDSALAGLLPSAAREVLTDRLNDERLEDIAKRRGVSKQCVHQLEALAIQKVRRRLRAAA